MLIINDSARKHGLGDDDLITLWESWIEQVWVEDDRPGRLLRVCIDDAGRPWEMVAIVFDDSRTMIIHAMRLRTVTAELVRKNR